MDELLDRLVAKVGVDRGVAEKAVGIILAFLLKEGPSDKVQTLINQMPGAETAMAAAASDGGLGMGGIMGVGTKLMAAGLGMDQMQGVTREIIDYAREKLGEDIADADPQKLVALARRKLREAFFSAEMGISGANFIVADSGAVAERTRSTCGSLGAAASRCRRW